MVSIIIDNDYYTEFCCCPKPAVTIPFRYNYDQCFLLKNESFRYYYYAFTIYMHAVCIGRSKLGLSL